MFYETPVFNRPFIVIRNVKHLRQFGGHFVCNQVEGIGGIGGTFGNGTGFAGGRLFGSSGVNGSGMGLPGSGAFGGLPGFLLILSSVLGFKFCIISSFNNRFFY